ncbi:MAG TPA: NB-ARC domain-containing protein [Urbifossiella sp.]|nr:NB-ARC domain-containing protein [Urbifossiella sp.]
MTSAAAVRGAVDFGVLTIRPDEYQSVLAHFPDRQTVEGSGYYEFSRVPAAGGGTRTVAVARALEQGQGSAADRARDMIEDLDPAWILLVGIAGGVPDDDYSLGDVLLASRVYDFGVSAALQDGDDHWREWGLQGGPVHPRVRAVLEALPGWGHKFGGWNLPPAVGVPKPGCAVPADPGSDRYYGPDAYRTKVRDSLRRHFPAGGPPRPPRYAVMPVADANTLVKDADLVAEWRRCARSLGFVEMEAGGVYRAARRANREYPVLVVRGLSDVVGFKRSPEWTDYACRTAASFAASFIRSGAVDPQKDRPHPNPPPPSSPPAPRPLVSGLPNLPELFLGRDGDAREVKERLGIRPAAPSPDPAPATVQVLTAVRGWPGVGKTSMAIWLAHDPDVRRAFPDGVLWASLGESPALLSVLASWGRRLGAEGLLRAPTVTDATAELTDALRGRRVLLVVDDVWTAEHAVPFRLATPVGGALLLTTRLPDVAEQLVPQPGGVYRLPVLDERYALDLLARLAPQVVAANPDECRGLVNALECLPLALHVAGRLLAAEAKNGWGVEDLLADLRAGADRLLGEPAPADRTDLDGQATPTVAVLLRRSTDRLAPAARDRFASLAAFAPKPATFDLGAVGAVWDVADARPTVRELVARGLLEPVGAGRYQMHALLVAHARSLCDV